MKSSVLSILVFTTLLTGCTLSPVKEHSSIIVGPGTFYAKWQNAVLKECNNKAAMITLQIVDEKIKEGYSIMEEDVAKIHKYLVEKCSLDNGIVI